MIGGDEMSCPFIKSNEHKNCEVCKITNKPTGVSLICDFDYDEKCEIYKTNLPKLRKQRK